MPHHSSHHSSHHWRAVAGVSALVLLWSTAATQDTYTQGASAERRTPAATKPLEDEHSAEDRPSRAKEPKTEESRSKESRSKERKSDARPPPQ